ncbi:Conserved_hypothetical protein [Hexamita inflata]|uniref:Uncharacterized protein n=1 Tax=Hexamita inflata TaxID=28002 RepID=A0ABP1IT67_9EUKA
MNYEDFYYTCCTEVSRQPLPQVVQFIKSGANSLSLADISKLDFYPISKTLPRIQRLAALTLSKVQIQPEHLIYLLENAKQLKQLIFQSIDLTLAPGILDHIVKALPQSLQELTCNACRVGDNFLKSVSQILPSSHLNVLNLQNNSFKNIKPLLIAIQQLNTPFSLNLSFCNLQAVHFNQLQQLTANCKNLNLISEGNKVQMIFSRVKTEHTPVVKEKKIVRQELKNESVQGQLLNLDLMDIQEYSNDFLELIQMVKEEQRPFNAEDLEILQQLIQALIMYVNKFNEHTTDKLQQNQLVYEQNIQTVQNYNQKVQTLLEQHHTQNQVMKYNINNINEYITQNINATVSLEEAQSTMQEIIQIQSQIQELNVSNQKDKLEIDMLQQQINNIDMQISQQTSNDKPLDEWKIKCVSATQQKVQMLIQQVAERRKMISEMVELYENE